MQAPHGKPQHKAKCCRPIAHNGTGLAALRLHLVQGSLIEATSQVAVDLGHAQRPQLGRRSRVRAQCVCWALNGSEAGRMTLDGMNAGAQAVQKGGPRNPCLRNGEWGLAVPVWARPKPGTRQTQTWVRS